MGRYRAYGEYKDSGVAWLGNVPTHWKTSSLRWYIEIASGDGLSNSDFDKSEDEINRFRVVGGNGTLGYTKFVNTESKAFAIGRVGALCGNVHFLNEMCWVTDNALKVSSWRNFDEQYLLHLLTSARLNEYASKSAQPLITGEQVKSLPVLLPPFHEQQKIANFLDHETAKIDTLIAKQQQLIKLLKEKRQAVISHAVTKGLNPNAPMRDSGVEWLGEVPEHWDVTSVGRLCEFISYGFTNPMPSTDEGPYMLTATDIEFGGVNYDSARRTSVAAFQTLLSPKSKPEKGDILLTKDGTLGRVAVFDGDHEACISQSVALLRLNQSVIIPEFLSMALMGANYQSKMIFDAGGTTIKHIYISILAKMRFVLPELSEQKVVLFKLNGRLLKLDQLIDKAQNAIGLMQERRTALVSAAVTGKIDVRDWQPSLSSTLQEAAA